MNYPPDSNVESSNKASLESGYRLPLFRHRGNSKCSRDPQRSQKACSTYIRTTLHLQRLQLTILCFKPATASPPAMLLFYHILLSTPDMQQASAPQSQLTNTFRSESRQ